MEIDALDTATGLGRMKIGIILGYGYRSQIQPTIIQPVTVDMVRYHALRGSAYQPMQVDRAPLSMLIAVEATISILAQMQRCSGNQRRIRIVNQDG